ncbi:unnamed protein product (macronuclear) [Paramecium tetraurelia]|uniref:Uncharacterized protein n=1 Tax=Paramecium tetraurelia TaxID=5888 RepID=A0DWU0_PARTE|nr:uncharacterized protein GSPATT00021150001 [Paramecium tetraurelia]CAK87507.1 unnamed protein product [Paramecium tetraurelia]|eukprot:XP_001454904.1 hypothetical protein (macronuclear) [Paramecium tetraurelia strain d4-2]
MGNCIAVRETSNKNPKSTPTYIDINNFIEHHKQLAQIAIEERKKKLEKQIQRVNNGGYGSSEEEDKVIIENIHEGDSGIQQLSDAQKSMMKDSIHSQNNKMSRQLTINSDTSVIQLQEKIRIQNEKLENHSDSDVYNYNSEDELEQFFGGTKSSKKQIKAKNILSSLINQGDKPPTEQIKTFKNTLFKKDDSEEQPVGNVFSDNDASFDDKSPDFKKK